MSCAERSTSDGARREPQIIDNLHRGASSISGAPSETNEERERADTLFEHLRNDVNVEGTSHGVQIRAEKRVGHPVQCLVQSAKDAEIDVLFLGAQRPFAPMGDVPGYDGRQSSTSRALLGFRRALGVDGSRSGGFAGADECAHEFAADHWRYQRSIELRSVQKIGCIVS